MVLVSLPIRILTLAVAFAAVVVGAGFIVIHYVLGGPPAVDYTGAASHGQVSVVLQEAPQTTVSSKPDWVTYFVMKPNANPHAAGSWVHTTSFQVPAGVRVNMTILGYDGCTPLRNNYWGQVEGTIGGTITVQQFRNTNVPLGPVVRTPFVNSWSHCSVAHTFAIPGLRLFVPAVSPGASASLCSTSPCTSGPFTLEKFSFLAPSHGGTWRWQCFIPCGGGFIDGNGGPMQTMGYMAGEMEVTR